MTRLAAVVAAALLLLPAVAHADGDPASDVLLSQDSYLPYSPTVQPKLKAALEKLLKRARDDGYPMKVALINTEADLGAYPQLFNQPQRYADLLEGELSSLSRHGDAVDEVHLLVVMPGGFGGSGLGDGVDRALAPVKITTDKGSDGLAQAALAGVARIATENGHELATPPEASIALGKASKTRSGGGTSPLLFVAPALLLFGGLFVAGRIAARRSSQ